MLTIIAWLVVSYCSYKLFFNRMDSLCSEWGGFTEYMKLYAEKEDDELSVAPHEFYNATTKAVILFTSLLLWPLLLIWILKTYLTGYKGKMTKQLGKNKE